MNNAHSHRLTSSVRSNAYNPNNLSIFPELLQPVNATETQQHLEPVVPQHSSVEDSMLPLVERLFMLHLGQHRTPIIEEQEQQGQGLWKGNEILVRIQIQVCLNYLSKNLKLKFLERTMSTVQFAWLRFFNPRHRDAGMCSVRIV
ncbi:uncharacterized protein LOC141661659 [Apium graveolens]|uniref:uncharacterized protein LOC141661659 n=1 Tax=Apium graveolens TaxID=4045 RepID=UPI003D7A0335